jgi:hypothetical protein
MKAPLSVRDVAVASQVLGVDTNAFLAELGARDLSCFAARPVTLLPMVEDYRDGQLPVSNLEDPG